MKRICGPVSDLIIPILCSVRNTHNSSASTLIGHLNQLIVIRTVENPSEYSSRVKWLITLLVSGAAATDPLSGTIFYRKLLSIELQYRD